MSRNKMFSRRNKLQAGKVERLRVTAGTFRGQKLDSPRSGAVHPMGSREKLALFNLLQPYLNAESRVLDLYAGSGALGIEALSRGVKEVTFVEKHPQVAEIIRSNLAKLGLDNSNIRILVQDAAKAAELLQNTQFDIIISDPPYNDFSTVATGLFAKLLSKDGILVLSQSKDSALAEFDGLELLKTRSYAGARISIYRRS